MNSNSIRASADPAPGLSRAGVALSCLAVVALAGCANGQKAPAAFERPPAPVSVLPAITRDVPVYLDEVGKCVAREVVSVQPQVS
ncbi:MAG TPA: hypothetical protein VJ144_03210, partial [Candidatus Polarisedimenticolia bacterium]|nr:hypothetical protein [Candidatus Polarisedimenticolia bacterium]